MQVVKAGFNQRRKTLRNALKPLGISPTAAAHPFMDKRAEQLSVADFVLLTNMMADTSELNPPTPEPFLQDTPPPFQTALLGGNMASEPSASSAIKIMPSES